MKWMGWKDIPINKQWMIICNSEDRVFILICVKHREAFCDKCGDPPNDAVKKLKFYKQLAKYE